MKTWRGRRASSTSSRSSVAVERHFLAAAPHRECRRLDLEVADDDRLLAGGFARAAQRGPQARATSSASSKGFVT